MREIIKLTRYKEHIPFVIPVSIIGALLGLQVSTRTITYEFIAVTIANILAVTYAFMINDIEDAPDDARDPKRKLKNPISSGRLSINKAYTATLIVGALSLIFYAWGNRNTLIVGTATLLLAHFYSWKPVRLKAWPLTDILSHSLMLSTLLAISTYSVYTTNYRAIWHLIASITLISMYGQLYNQIRDFKLDKKAKLKNTAIVMGEDNAKKAMYALLILATASFGVSIYKDLFPFWLLIPVLISTPIGFVFKNGYDPRGTKAIDAVGSLQNVFWFVANITVISWLVRVVL